MKNKAFDLKKWDFKPTDRVLPDANFWINVFGPAATVAQPSDRIKAYSNALQSMIQKQVTLYLDVLIMSEFVNTLARMEFNTNFRNAYRNSFKRFRNSNNFLPIARTISSECRKILKLCERVDHPITEWDFTKILTRFEQGGEDFNDQLIIETSSKNNFILLTDDGDMTEGNLKVLTANRRLLEACPS